MGRKIDMKKIQDVTKCQVTFSKRRSSLIKKANEIAICCDVDVAFVAFSPSGRVSKFCNQRRIEDVLRRFVDLPPERRLTDYELGPEQEPSLHQLCWSERNLNRSLEKVIAWKNALLSCNGSTSYSQPTMQMEQQELGSQFGVPFSYNSSENELGPTNENSNSTGQILLQLDPWISPYSARFRDSILKDLLLDPSNPTPNNVNQGSLNKVTMLPIQDSLSIFESHSGIFPTSFDPPIPSPQIPHQQSLAVDQTLLCFPNQINNVTSDGLGNPAPRFTSSTTVPTNVRIIGDPQILCDGMDQNELRYENLKWSELANMPAEEYTSHFSNNKISVSSGDANYSTGLNYYGIPKGIDHSVDPFRAHPTEVDNFGESSLGTSRNLTSGQWEWEDFLLDDNVNFGDFTK
ncbi:hypothetical protein F511_39630 [Dorcoceras hygrometricum]|uniref:MADS-box domain-containing protein n=1 Tax=Dorcoceras hygrometricum TaxID=472368 RepID=A0A2Z7C7R3_9LAMI|nr:hypothetical protein F511_39630 [Dorcoceras hygrometricum]